jgi:hypothetical protein
MQYSDLAMVDAESNVRSHGEHLEIQRLRGSRINFAWSNESERLVIINARGTNEAECAFFQVGGTFVELPERSKRLTEMKIVALAFTTYHSASPQYVWTPKGRRCAG